MVTYVVSSSSAKRDFDKLNREVTRAFPEATVFTIERSLSVNGGRKAELEKFFRRQGYSDISLVRSAP